MTKKQLRINIESIFKEMEKVVTELPAHGFKGPVIRRLAGIEREMLKLCRFWVFKWPRYKDPQFQMLLNEINTGTDYLAEYLQALAYIIWELPRTKESLRVLTALVGIRPQLNAIYRYESMKRKDG